jgi:hypothetical protein
MRHIHVAQHRDGDGEVLAGPVALTGPAVELAEAEEAARLERAHARLSRSGQAFRVVALCVQDPSRLGRRLDISEHMPAVSNPVIDPPH